MSSPPFPAQVGRPAPEFSLACVRGRDERVRTVNRSDYSGRWLLLIFYPRDFSFVCPTELTAFSARLAEFQSRGCELLGVSVDTVETHQQWLTTPVAEGGLGPLQFPLASDSDGAVARAFGIWDEQKAVSLRGLFVIDPQGRLQYSVVHNLSVGRSPDEVLRVLDALRSGGLCPASWTSADGTIDAERALQPGRTLGHYRLREKLGGGTFGTVFAAWDLRLERMVALKVLKRKFLESREAALAEARAAARLNHPHVCTIYSVEETDGLPVIVMEYLDGRILSEALAGLPRRRVLRLAAQIAAGVAAAHARNIVHGDLKPANIIVTRDGTAKILDFGLGVSQQPSIPPGLSDRGMQVDTATADGAKRHADVDATIDHAQSPTGQPIGIRGTLAYMSPEQAMGMPAVPASDVFSFGLILLEMLTGRRALADELPIRLLFRLQSDDLGSEIVSGVEGADRALLAPMLARDAAQRPPITEVARRLAAIAPSE